MKTIISSLFCYLLFSTCLAQPIPTDSLYLSQACPGNLPVVFQLQSSSGLRPVERISISSDGKEIYYSELDGWPPSNSRVKCYKYLSNRWQGPFIIFEGFVAPGLSMNDSTIYMQRDTLGTSWTFYSTRNSTGWSTPVKLLSTNMQTHYFQETQLKNYYLASTPGGNSDICRLVIHNSDTTIQSLGVPINNLQTENDFFIARDESYIIFFRLSSPYNLFISYHRADGKWTNPKSFGPNINTNIYECCPFVTRDNKYLFFTRGASAMSSYYTYWVKIDNIIDSLRHTNFIPYLKNQISNQSDTVGHLFTFTVPDSTFVDDDGNNTLTYSATLYGGGSLPSWLSFNPSTRTFSGTPTEAGTLTIKLTVTDTANTSTFCIFYLGVSTSIHEKNGVIANEYKLYQNYPNPFNPVTNINFALPKSGNISLKIYDFTGKEVYNLFSGYLKSGNYNFIFEAGNLSSGVYIYELKSGDFTETKKMVLIK